MKNFRFSLLSTLLLALVTAAPVARADVTFNLYTVINGSTPVGASPWLTATFQDIAANDVRLTLTNNMPAGEFVDDLVFNSLLNPTTLNFNNNTPGAALATVTTSATQSLDGGANMKAGLFNIWYSFTTANNAGRFDGGDVSIWEITGTGVDASDFLLTSINKPNPNGSAGGWYMAAHVQGIPGLTGTTSGSIGDDGRGPPTSIPEPETYAMMLAGLGLMGFVARRRKQKAA